MSRRGLVSPKRLAVSTALAMIASLFVMVGPAYAAPTCTAAGDVLTVTLVTDSTTALRVVGGALEFSEGATATTNPPTGFAACAGGALAAIDRINIVGSGAGNETLRIIADATWDAETVVTYVDLGNGNDKLDFTVDAAGEDLELTMGVGTGSARVVDLADFAGDADLRINNAETVSATGAGVAVDHVHAGGTAAITPSAVDPAHDIPGSPLDAEFDFPILFTGSEGDDYFEPGNAADTFLGGAGDDAVDYTGADAAVVVDLGAGTATGGSGADTLTDVQIATGSTFADTLTGSTINNTLNGGDGNDTIDGLAGNDSLNGGLGDDVISQGAAADGADVMTGGGGTDRVDYGARTTDLFVDVNGVADDGAGGCPLGTGCEDDNVGVDVEIVETGSGNDTLVGSGGAVRFQPGGGNDAVTGNGDDAVDFAGATAGVTVDVRAGTATGEGNDTFTPTNVDWDFRGGDFDDTFIDNTDQDNGYVGRGGNDLFDQSADPEGDEVTDDDTFDGDDGDDTLDYSLRTTDLEICLDGENTSACTATDNGEDAESDDVLDDIENGTGGSGDDDMAGNEANNLLTGNLGNDFMSGEEGNDSFPQGAAPDGSDTVDGDEGADSVDYSQRTGDVRATLSGGGNQGEAGEGDNLDDVENASTGSGNDLLVGNFDDNILLAGGGRDIVNGATGQDQMSGQGGRDRVSYATGEGVTLNLKNKTGAETGGGFDTVRGFENATGSRFGDIIIGTRGRNSLRGLGGSDVIKAGSGRDNLKGDQGRDQLNGGKGRDKGNGGPGRDRCRKVERRISC